VITLRPVVEEDEEFLCRVYGSTREPELALVDWDDTQKQAFVRQQFEAQHRHYHQHYRNTSFDVILVGGERAGRLYVARWSSEMRIVDIALLPAFRGRGVGTKLLRELQAEAADSGRKVSIHVERFNPAMSLYLRLGFQPVNEGDVYVLMEWRAPAQVNTAS
jgi:ribosomal protein S18 acetylase RimI-like enzyme